METGSYLVSAGADLDLRGARELGSFTSITGLGNVKLSGDLRVDGGLISVQQLTIESLLVRLTGAGYPVFRSAGPMVFSGQVELRAEPGFCPTLGAVLTPFQFGSASASPSVAVTDAEFTTTTAVLADRITFTITSVGCDITAPTMSGITLEAPRQTDRILERVVTTDAADNIAITQYQYVWTPGTAAPMPTGTTRTVVVTGQQLFNVSFSDASPNAAWSLFVRALDRKGNATPWRVWRVPATPAAPLLLAVGDSVTAGHHRDGAFTNTQCEDQNYGYPHYVQDGLNAGLPDAWRFRYTNLAQSGYTTQAVLTPAAKDACGRSVSEVNSQLELARQQLIANRGSWNRVVVSAGINDTNWGGMVIPTMALAGRSSWLFTGAGQLFFGGLIDSAGCQAAAQTWDFESKRDQIRNNVTMIKNGLHDADPAAKIAWNAYFNIAGTGIMPGNCSSAITGGLSRLRDEINVGLRAGGDVATLIDNTNLPGYMIQPWYVDDAIDVAGCGVYGAINGPCHRPPGWPHPNSQGAQWIANNNVPSLQ